MKKSVVSMLMFLFCCTLAPTVSAQGMLEKISADKLGEIMTREGYSYTVDEDGDLVWKLEGYGVYLIIAADRESVQFRCAFNDGNATMNKVNEWNRTKKYSRSYLDKEGDPVLELDLDFAGGVSEERVKDFLTTCRASVIVWVKEVVR